MESDQLFEHEKSIAPKPMEAYHQSTPEVATQKVDEDTLALKAIGKSPEVIMDKVEKLYELRHEAKDEAATPRTTSDSQTSVKTEYSVDKKPISVSGASSMSVDRKLSGPASPFTGMYRRAIAVGFFAGLLLLITFIITRTVFR